MPSLKETYKKNDKIPFGGSVVYNELKEDFDSVIVVERKQQLPYDGSLDDDEAVPVSFGDLFVIITPRIFMTEEEANSLVAFVRRGNDLMIAAADLDSYFLELIGVQIINVPAFLNVCRARWLTLKCRCPFRRVQKQLLSDIFIILC